MTKALVIGDIMLDATIECEVSRVSPEAPVVIGRERNRKAQLGGAANVAANLKALGVDDVYLYGVTGDEDDAAHEVEELCKDLGIFPRFEYRTAQRTTVKTRYVAEGQLIFRHDAERHSISSNYKQHSTAKIDVTEYDVIVFVDYDKGVVGDYDTFKLIAQATAAQIPVVVDCKPCNLPFFTGATFITPNEAELAEMCLLYLPAVERSLEQDTHELAAGFGIKWVVCTRGGAGLDVYFVARDYIRNSIEPPTRFLPKQTRRVYDVTGAGDVVTAALGSVLARERAWSKLPLASQPAVHDSMFEFANTAAGLAVEQPGTTVVDLDAVITAQTEDRLSSKILLEGAETAVEALQAVGRCVVFTNGCFDLLHPGHVHLLHAAKSEGDALVVAVNSDESVRALKGDKRPVLPLHLRMAALASLDVVDYVVPFDEETPEGLIRKLKPDVLVKGKHTTDCPHQDAPVPGADFMAARGARVVFVDTIPGYSTTAVIAGGTS
jgi:D-beta-D-heptose 7-phosphate kinase/D-beta-D-heptose 1-phosphate adenosyltransferase